MTFLSNSKDYNLSQLSSATPSPTPPRMVSILALAPARTRIRMIGSHPTKKGSDSTTGYSKTKNSNLGLLKRQHSGDLTSFEIKKIHTDNVISAHDKSSTPLKDTTPLKRNDVSSDTTTSVHLFDFVKSPKSLLEIWLEYKYPKLNNRSIEQMDESYGEGNWVDVSQKPIYQDRVNFCQKIKEGISLGYTTNEMISLMEKDRTHKKLNISSYTHFASYPKEIGIKNKCEPQKNSQNINNLDISSSQQYPPFTFLISSLSFLGIWNHYMYPGDNKFSLKEMLEKYGKEWVNKACHPVLFRRLKLCKAIELGLSKGYSLDQCLNFFETDLKRSGLSIREYTLKKHIPRELSEDNESFRNLESTNLESLRKSPHSLKSSLDTDSSKLISSRLDSEIPFQYKRTISTFKEIWEEYKIPNSNNYSVEKLDLEYGEGIWVGPLANIYFSRMRPVKLIKIGLQMGLAVEKCYSMLEEHKKSLKLTMQAYLKSEDATNQFSFFNFIYSPHSFEEIWNEYKVSGINPLSLEQYIALRGINFLKIYKGGIYFSRYLLCQGIEAGLKKGFSIQECLGFLEKDQNALGIPLNQYVNNCVYPVELDTDELALGINPPDFIFKPGMTSWESVWNEYKVPGLNKLSIGQMDQKYGKKWVNSSKSNTYLRRKKVINLIEGGLKYGYSLEKCFEILDKKLKESGQSTIYAFVSTSKFPTSIVDFSVSLTKPCSVNKGDELSSVANIDDSYFVNFNPNSFKMVTSPLTFADIWKEYKEPGLNKCSIEQVCKALGDSWTAKPKFRQTLRTRIQLCRIIETNLARGNTLEECFNRLEEHRIKRRLTLSYYVNKQIYPRELVYDRSQGSHIAPDLQELARELEQQNMSCGKTPDRESERVNEPGSNTLSSSFTKHDLSLTLATPPTSILASTHLSHVSSTSPPSSSTSSAPLDSKETPYMMNNFINSHSTKNISPKRHYSGPSPSLKYRPSTFTEIWDEFHYNIVTQEKTFEEMDEFYGETWRAHEKTSCLRRMICFAIINGLNKGYSLTECLNIFEMHKKSSKLRMYPYLSRGSYPQELGDKRTTLKLYSGPEFKFEPNLNSFEDLWAEYTTARLNECSMQQMVESYGSTFAPDSTKRTFLLRLRVCRAIDVGLFKGYDLEQCFKFLRREQERLNIKFSEMLKHKKYIPKELTSEGTREEGRVRKVSLGQVKLQFFPKTFEDVWKEYRQLGGLYELDLKDGLRWWKGTRYELTVVIRRRVWVAVRRGVSRGLNVDQCMTLLKKMQNESGLGLAEFCARDVWPDLMS